MNRRHKQFIGLVFLLFITILMVCPMGGNSIKNISVIGFRADYIIHCLTFIPWMFVGGMLYGERLISLFWFAIGIVAVIALEYIQMLLPYRSFNNNDLMSGIIGVSISYSFFKLIKVFNDKAK